MNADAVSVALNALALLGAGAYVFCQWSAREPTPVDVRLAALLALLMALVGVRAARWFWQNEDLRHVEEALAAFVPLFSLTLAEGLLRRHTPMWLKTVVVIGAFALAIAALARPASAAGDFAIVLGVFLTALLAIILILLAARTRASLAPGENAAIGALSVGLIVALPLVATDFLAAAGAAPVRAGGLGLIVFVFAAARVTAAGGDGFSVLTDLFWSAVAASVGYGVLGFVMGWPQGTDALRVYALVAALVLLFRIVQFVREQRRARRRASLWRAFAEAPDDGLEAFLSRVLLAPELARSRLLVGDDLAAFDEHMLNDAFATHAVISARDARFATAAAREQLDVLFDTHEATHAVLVGTAPLRLLLVNLPRVGAGPDAALQLDVLAKLARQAGAAHA